MILIATALAPGAARAGADDDDAMRWPHRTTALYLTAGGRYLGDRSVAAPGVTGELAWGWGRWQALVDGRAGWAFAGRDGGGPAIRAGAGVRWLARSYQPDSSAALQLYLDVGASVEHLALADGGLTLPSAWAGWGWQVRAMRDHHRVMIRFVIRIELSPSVDRARVDQLLCRGACGPTVTSSPLDEGFSGGVGVAW